MKNKVLFHAPKYCKVIFHTFLNSIEIRTIVDLGPSTDAFHKAFCITELSNDQGEEHLNVYRLTHHNTERVSINLTNIILKFIALVSFSKAFLMIVSDRSLSTSFSKALSSWLFPMSWHTLHSRTDWFRLSDPTEIGVRLPYVGPDKNLFQSISDNASSKIISFGGEKNIGQIHELYWRVGIDK